MHFSSWHFSSLVVNSLNLPFVVWHARGNLKLLTFRVSFWNCWSGQMILIYFRFHRNGIQSMSIIFSKPDKRTQWEQVFNEAKQKIGWNFRFFIFTFLSFLVDGHFYNKWISTVSSLEKYPVPEFISCIPIRKTRAGLQFTCAAPTLGSQKDVWVCNSDGYVGQVCVLSLFPEPTVVSCNGVCNARILCVTSIPANVES